MLNAALRSSFRSILGSKTLPVYSVSRHECPVREFVCTSAVALPDLSGLRRQQMRQFRELFCSVVFATDDRQTGLATFVL